MSLATIALPAWAPLAAAAGQGHRHRHRHRLPARSSAESSGSVIVDTVASLASATADVSTDYIPSWVQKSATVGFTITLTVLLSQRARGGADKAKSQQVRSYTGLSDEEKDRLRAEKIENQKKLTWSDTLGGSLSSGALALVMWAFTTNVVNSFDTKTYASQSSQYTVQQVSTTVRTIIEGLAYLFSSVLSVVSLGLAALTLQLLVNPTFLREQQPEQGVEGSSKEEGENKDG